VLQNGVYSLSNMAAFVVTNGQFPTSNLLPDGNGNYYGTMGETSSDNPGGVYELSPAKKGDVNLDGFVNSKDISAMLKALTKLSVYQSSNLVSNAQLLSIADIDGDGFVNNRDIQPLLNLVASLQGTVVPEPSTFALFAIGVIALCKRRLN
jgi:hypothetical protein